MSAEQDILKATAISWIKEAVRELTDEQRVFLSNDETARTLAEINAKPFVTMGEAALLLGCSTSHLSKQIKEARKKKAKRPIPFLQIGDAKVYSFPREELLEWGRRWARTANLSLVEENESVA